MKIGVILGRGVEGVGLTKNVVEFQKLFPWRRSICNYR